MEVGDKVRVLADADVEKYHAPKECRGQQGVILYGNGQLNYDVEFGNGDVWWIKGEHLAPITNDSVFIVVDESDEITAEHRSLEAAERDAKGSAEYCKETFTVYQRIVSFGVKTEVVETRG